MRDPPVGLFVVCGEQPVMRDLTQLVDADGYDLLEPFLIAHLVHQFPGVDEVDRGVSKVQSVDGACVCESVSVFHHGKRGVAQLTILVAQNNKGLKCSAWLQTQGTSNNG